MNQAYTLQNKLLLNGCLFAMVVVLFLLNFYSETLFYRPTSLHLWRQADCLSITKNYFEEGMHFLSPKIHSLRAPQGMAVSELPLINYTVALLWKIFGEHEFIYKLLDYFIFLLAIFVLFNTLIRHFLPGVYALFLVSVLLTSPLLVYYSLNFLSDVPALSFAIISFSLLFSFSRTKKLTSFYFSLLTATLAVLLKASALMPMVLLTVFLFADVFKLNNWIGTGKLFHKTFFPVVFTGLSLVLIYSWYSFARQYNSFNNGVFLLTVAPIWEMPKEAVMSNLKSLFTQLFPVFLNRPMLALVSGLLIFILFNFRKLDGFLKYSFVGSGIFFVLYILIFFQVFTVHDYYLINLFIFPVISFFCLLRILQQIHLSSEIYLKSLLTIIFVFNAFFSAASYRVKLIEKDNMLDWYPFIAKDEINGFEYMMWDFKRSLVPVIQIKPMLRELGIKRSDVVLSLTDGGPNVALYFMDQKGYVLVREQIVNDSLCLQKLLPKKVKYMIINDPAYKQEKSFKRIEPLFACIYQKSAIEIYKRK